jgi:hypothetical protein
MPQPPTPNMNLVQPLEDSDIGLWDSLLTDVFELIDSHDHTTGRGARVPSAGIRINADLSMADGGNFYALKDVKAIDFTPRPASEMTAYAAALFFNSSDANNLYARTQSGVNVRITNGSQLDITAVGGIVGDYAAVAAEVAFSSAGKEYTFKQASPTKNWAALHSGPVRIAQLDTTESLYVELIAPAALAATYTITLPLAVPGANGTLVQSTTGGVLSFSNSGLAGLALASGQHFTVSGSGEYKHGDKTLTLPGHLALAVNDPTLEWHPNSAATGWVSSALADRLSIPISLEAGVRIKSVTVFYQRAGGTPGIALVRQNLTSGATSTVASTTIPSGTSRAGVTLSSINHTVLSTDEYYIDIDSGTGGENYFGAQVVFDRP